MIPLVAVLLPTPAADGELAPRTSVSTNRPDPDPTSPILPDLPALDPVKRSPKSLEAAGVLVAWQEPARSGKSRIAETGRLVGTVRDSKGYVRSGFSVTVSPADGNQVERTTATDDWGEYAFDDLPPGDWFLSYELDGLRMPSPPDGSAVHVPAGFQRTQDVLLPAPCVVRGHVLRDGQPVAGALVQFNAGPVTTLAESNDLGEFRLMVSRPFTGSLWARSDDLPTPVVEVHATAEGVDGVELRFGQARITGQLVHARTGQPVHDASVTVMAPEDTPGAARTLTRRTDTDGRFEVVDVFAGTWRVSGSSRLSFHSPWIELSVPESGTTDVTLSLEPSASLRGVVRDSDGQLVKHSARVVLHDERGATFERNPQDRHGLPRGRFSFWDLPGGDYQLTVEVRDRKSARRPSYTEVTRVPVRLVAGEEVHQDLMIDAAELPSEPGR